MSLVPSSSVVMARGDCILQLKFYDISLSLFSPIAARISSRHVLNCSFLMGIQAAEWSFQSWPPSSILVSEVLVIRSPYVPFSSILAAARTCMSQILVWTGSILAMFSRVSCLALW